MPGHPAGSGCVGSGIWWHGAFGGWGGGGRKGGLRWGGACEAESGQQVSGRGRSQSSRMMLASTMTRAPRLMPMPPALRAAAPGRQAPSGPQRHTVTFRGCSRCWGGCPESRSSRLRRCRPSRTWCRSRRRAWLTAEGAQGQHGPPNLTRPAPAPPGPLHGPSTPLDAGRSGLVGEDPETWGLSFPILPLSVTVPAPPEDAAGTSRTTLLSAPQVSGLHPLAGVWKNSPLTWLTLQFRVSSGTRGLS